MSAGWQLQNQDSASRRCTSAGLQNAIRSSVQDHCLIGWHITRTPHMQGHKYYTADQHTAAYCCTQAHQLANMRLDNLRKDDCSSSPVQHRYWESSRTPNHQYIERGHSGILALTLPPRLSIECVHLVPACKFCVTATRHQSLWWLQLRQVPASGQPADRPLLGGQEKCTSKAFASGTNALMRLTSSRSPVLPSSVSINACSEKCGLFPLAIMGSQPHCNRREDNTVCKHMLLLT